MSKRGFLLSGAWGLGNTGDEAILAAMVERLHTLAPEEPLRVLSMGPGEKTPGVEFIPARDLGAVLRAMRKSRVLLSGGGTLLQDITSSKSLWYYLGVMVLARAMGCRVMVFAAGLGPIERPFDRFLTRLVLACFPREITLRDSGSLAYLRSLGVKRGAKVTADAAFLHPFWPKTGGKNALFCMRFWPGFEDKWAEISRAAAQVQSELGLEPMLLPLGKEDEKVPGSGIKILQKPDSWRAAVRILQESALVISMRLHGLILSGGTPAVGISIDPKIEGFCTDQNLQSLPVSELSAENILSAARAALAQNCSAAIELARKKAEDNFDIAMELYNK